MKILAYTLIVLGPFLMALGHPFADQPDFPMMFVGAVLGITGVFLRSRLRQGIPILAVTDKDKTLFKELRREFGLRNILGQLLGAFGAFFLLAAISAPLYSKDGKYDWRVSLVVFVFGVILICCAKPLIRKSR